MKSQNPIISNPVTVSHIVLEQVKNFLTNNPLVEKMLINNSASVLDLQRAAMDGKFPFTGLLKCCYQYINFEPTSTEKTLRGNTVLIYVERGHDFTESMINCTIKNY